MMINAKIYISKEVNTTIEKFHNFLIYFYEFQTLLLNTKKYHLFE